MTTARLFSGNVKVEAIRKRFIGIATAIHTSGALPIQMA